MIEYVEGDPAQSGLYVAYVNGPMVVVADRIMLTFMVGKGWSYPLSDQKFRDHVYACVGPFPVLKLEA
jgi:hypothetical protein